MAGANPPRLARNVLRSVFFNCCIRLGIAGVWGCGGAIAGVLGGSGVISGLFGGLNSPPGGICIGGRGVNPDTPVFEGPGKFGGDDARSSGWSGVKGGSSIDKLDCTPLGKVGNG